MNVDPNAPVMEPELADDEEGVWNALEEQVKDPNAKPGGSGMKSLYLWTIDPTALPIAGQSDQRFCIFYHDLKWNGKTPVDPKKIALVRWKDWEDYRLLTRPYRLRTPDSLKGILYGNEYDTTETYIVRTKRGGDVGTFPLSRMKTNRDPFFDKFFEQAFVLGQQVAEAWPSNNGPLEGGWTKLSGQTWQMRTSTSPDFDEANLTAPGGVDRRTFDTKSDGFAFVLGSPTTLPSEKEAYIKVNDKNITKTEDTAELGTKSTKNDKKQTTYPSHAKQLMFNDTLARWLGNSATALYIARKTVDELRAGSYDWTVAGGRVHCRQANGQLNSIGIASRPNLGNGNPRSSQWWEDCFKFSIKQDVSPVRSRNPKPMELLLVVMRFSSVKVEELRKIVNDIKAKTKGPKSNQTAKVIGSSDPQLQKEKTIYNYKVRQNPPPFVEQY